MLIHHSLASQDPRQIALRAYAHSKCPATAQTQETAMYCDRNNKLTTQCCFFIVTCSTEKKLVECRVRLMVNANQENKEHLLPYLNATHKQSRADGLAALRIMRKTNMDLWITKIFP